MAKLYHLVVGSVELISLKDVSNRNIISNLIGKLGSLEFLREALDSLVIKMLKSVLDAINCTSFSLISGSSNE